MRKRLVLFAAGIAASLSCAAAKQPANGTPANDLTVPVRLHRAACPPPAGMPCVMQRPVGNGYRVLTSGVSVEVSGDRWVVTLDKPANGSLLKTIRVMDAEGGLHDIEISYAARAKK